MNYLNGYFFATEELESALIAEGHEKPEQEKVNGWDGAWDSLSTDIKVIELEEGTPERPGLYGILT